MPIKLKNNVSSTLAAPISASDVGLIVATGTGAQFPTLGTSDYFYATLVSTGGTIEVVKVTARVGDTMTIVRAQDGSTANSFAAGARVEMRVNAQAVVDIGRDYVSVKDFGAVGNDVADDTAAIQAAIDSISGVGGVVYFPPGTYKVTSQLNITKDNIYLKGSGTRASAIRVHHNTGYGVRIEAAINPGSTYINNFYMSDISIRARVKTTGNACLYLNKAQQVYLDNISLEDHYGGLHLAGGNQHYYTNINILSPRTTAPLNWTGVEVGSFFFKCGKSSAGHTPFELYVSNFNFRRNESFQYIENGIVINAVDGIWFNNGHIMGVDKADMLIEPVVGDEQITGILCNNIWFDNNSELGVNIKGSTTGLFGEILLVGCSWLQQDNIAVFAEAGANFDGLRISGGWIIRSGSFGILLRSGASHVISGVFFGACNRADIVNTSAISIDNGVDNVTITGCEFNQSVQGRTSPFMQGVRVNTTTSTGIFVTSNSFRLDAAMPDIVDVSLSNNNSFENNFTDKLPTLTLSGAVLQIPEIGAEFSVPNGLNFANVSGRWNGRRVTLIFAGSSVVTHGSIRLAGSTSFTAAAGDSLSLVYSASSSFWVETGRMVA